MYKKGMPFAQEDVQRARNVNLVEYLESCGAELKRKLADGLLIGA